MGDRGRGAVDDPAQFLLGHTGELRLTDAQVTRLAAIARRSAERRRAHRAQMDSVRPERMATGRPDSAARAAMRQRFEQMRPQLERLRDQSQADRRDAIAILTPDQQALAWERIAAGQMQRWATGDGRRKTGDGRRTTDDMGGGFGRGFGPPRGRGRQ
jgi:Spy/CpxP family protein refolding chaperone